MKQSNLLWRNTTSNTKNREREKLTTQRISCHFPVVKISLTLTEQNLDSRIWMVRTTASGFGRFKVSTFLFSLSAFSLCFLSLSLSLSLLVLLSLPHGSLFLSHGFLFLSLMAGFVCEKSVANFFLMASIYRRFGLSRKTTR